MIDIFIRALRNLLYEAVRDELQRIGRDVTPNDNLDFFEKHLGTHINPDGMIMSGEMNLAPFDAEIFSVDELATLYEELKAIDDDQDGILAVGRAVLESIGLQGRDVVDVLDAAEGDNSLIGTGDGRVFSFNTFEVGNADHLIATQE